MKSRRVLPSKLENFSQKDREEEGVDEKRVIEGAKGEEAKEEGEQLAM
jgi:hypothetical protein